VLPRTRPLVTLNLPPPRLPAGYPELAPRCARCCLPTIPNVLTVYCKSHRRNFVHSQAKYRHHSSSSLKSILHSFRFFFEINIALLASLGALLGPFPANLPSITSPSLWRVVGSPIVTSDYNYYLYIDMFT